jgi:hypothetical protein
MKSKERMMPGHDVSNDADCSSREWRRSSRSYGSGNCLEVAARYGALIDVRDSKDPHGPVLHFSALEWSAFLVDVRSHEPCL